MGKIALYQTKKDNTGIMTVAFLFNCLVKQKKKQILFHSNFEITMGRLRFCNQNYPFEFSYLLMSACEKWYFSHVIIFLKKCQLF